MRSNCLLCAPGKAAPTGVPAVVRCVALDLWLCELDGKLHGVRVATRQHRLVNLPPLPAATCATHGDSSDWICTECRETYCVHCTKDVHRGHRTCKMKNYAANLVVAERYHSYGTAAR